MGNGEKIVKGKIDISMYTSLEKSILQPAVHTTQLKTTII